VQLVAATDWANSWETIRAGVSSADGYHMRERRGRESPLSPKESRTWSLVGSKGASSIDGTILVHNNCTIRSINRFTNPSPDRGSQNSLSCCGRNQSTYVTPAALLRHLSVLALPRWRPIMQLRDFSIDLSTNGIVVLGHHAAGVWLNKLNLSGRFVVYSKADRSRDH